MVIYVPTILQVVTPIVFEKVIFCSPPQYRSALVATRMRNMVLLDYLGRDTHQGYGRVIHITCNHTIAFFTNCSEIPNSC